MSNQERVLRYWQKDKPLPEGWKECASLDGTHHGAYSRIIEQINDTENTETTQERQRTDG